MTAMGQVAPLLDELGIEAWERFIPVYRSVAEATGHDIRIVRDVAGIIAEVYRDHGDPLARVWRTLSDSYNAQIALAQSIADTGSD